MRAARPTGVTSMSDNNEDLLRVFIEQAPVAIAMLDRDMRYIAASRRWLSDYDLQDRQLHGLSHYDVFPDMPDRWHAIHRRALGGEVIACDEDRFDRAEGDTQWLHWEVRPWYGSEGLGGILIFAEDVTARRRAQEGILRMNVELEQRVLERTAQLEESVGSLQQALEEAEHLRQELREQAIRDPLTGLFNRRFMEETLDHEVARARRTSSQLGIVMFDMDNFKTLNDSFGHAAGDAVLRGVGRLVTERVRAQDVVCRYGGDEFIIVMPDTSIENASHTASQLYGRLRHLNAQIRDLALPEVEFSMGVAAFPDHGISGMELLKSVDAALYRAKQQGGGRVIAAV
jgi:diguanylate cyclase (GGDEF)-like protein/PAS domain S-box-containing protein